MITIPKIFLLIFARTSCWKFEFHKRNTMRNPICRLTKSLPLLAALAAAPMPTHAETFRPDFRVKPDDVTVLHAADVPPPAGTKIFQGGAHGKFFMRDWTRSDQVFRWEVTVPQGDDYQVNILARRNSEAPLRVEVQCGERKIGDALTIEPRKWNRQTLPGTLRLEAGAQSIALRVAAPDTFSAELLSIELVRPAVREKQLREALALRADTAWLQKARFGLMVHWTAQSMPQRGERKPYAEAVQNFDVEKFADQVQATGAGFLVLTTSHALMYFPAPLKSLDAIFPGRTAPRDLVAELAAALKKRGMKLFLYYHIGAVNDSAWLRASSFWETDTTKIFDNWTAIISEAGARYKEDLAGWWFDDGTTNYYYRSAPWQRLTRAAKAGNPARLVAYNPWELPAATQFQDYFCGEGNGDPGSGGALTPGDNGLLRGGSHAGMQACATLNTESDWDWVHDKRDTTIGPPRWNIAQLADILRRYAALKNVPIFNCEIYQEGTISPQTVERFRAANALAF